LSSDDSNSNERLDLETSEDFSSSVIGSESYNIISALKNKFKNKSNTIYTNRLELLNRYFFFFFCKKTNFFRKIFFIVKCENISRLMKKHSIDFFSSSSENKLLLKNNDEEKDELCGLDDILFHSISEDDSSEIFDTMIVDINSLEKNPISMDSSYCHFNPPKKVYEKGIIPYSSTGSSSIDHATTLIDYMFVNL
jgi:hypothetical protein